MIIRSATTYMMLHARTPKYTFVREQIRKYITYEPKEYFQYPLNWKTFADELKENTQSSQTLKKKIKIGFHIFTKYFRYFLYFLFKLLYFLLDNYKRFIILGIIFYYI
ncbi:unnamed protein product [Paramecium sonneborni]|uniref:Uncharacterized protein n=1 Tax=Paramecium sonneborni TaxID=65129 RepID=A0A8S1QXJ7_9CILI|nr:unnamed protein product [Paramecium sonneborni]